jgi:nitrite reductase/ring-hydroxylating ferredoxin subunit
VPVSEAKAGRRKRTRVHVGALADFNAERFTIVEAGSETIGVLRLDDGVTAMRNYCPHMGGRLCRGDVRGTMWARSPDEMVYDEEALIVRCPMHRWEWSIRDGSPVGRVTNLRAKVFDSEVVDEQVYVYV